MTTHNKERQFWHALENIFIGVPVEGESGYINLMRLKQRYFQHALQTALQQTIQQQLQPFPDFRPELFDKLYTFFKRYFTESGSIGFFFTPYHQSVYERIYTNEQDITLFWKTARLYYIKTDRLFQSMDIELDEFRFHFDASTLEHKRANEKRQLIFHFKERKDDGTLVFTVAYSERGTITKIDDLRRQIRQQTQQTVSSETLERAFHQFERQSEVDYFLCKDARAFLREQFDLWLWQYLLGTPSEESHTDWTETRLKQLQALKHIAYRLIDLIAAFEDELVKVWNKPKFVRQSGYVITLDRIEERDVSLLEAMTKHAGFHQQMEEWRTLGLVDDGFSADALWETDLMGRRLNTRYRFLPLDTRYFKDLEVRLLELFEDLEEALDGWLVRSENYQALQTLLPRFRGRVQTIYIDPPYNTGSDDFLYRDRFRHSSWLTMMENRLSLAREWLSDSGVMFVSLDDNEMPFLRQILDATWGSDSYLETFIWNNTATPPSLSKTSRRNAEYILSYTKKCLKLPLRGRKSQGHDAPLRNAGNRRIEIVLPPKTVSFYIPDGTYSRGKKGEVELLDDVVVEGGTNLTPVRLLLESKWTQEKIDAEIQRGTRFLVKSKNFSVRYKKPESENDWITPDKYIDSIFLSKKAGVGTNEDANTEIQNLCIEFDGYPKPVSLVLFFVRSNTKEDSYILDFFAGSGTTAHAVIDLNRSDGGRRKYTLVEMADYVETIVLPRIKKVIFSDKWKDGSPQKGQGVSHFLKYYTLESFEDALRHTRYADDTDLFTNWEEKITYLFLRDEKMAHALEVDLENNAVRVDLSCLYPDIDLAETLANLTGNGIRRILPDPEDPTTPSEVELTDGTRHNLKNPDWRVIKPLIWW